MPVAYRLEDVDAEFQDAYNAGIITKIAVTKTKVNNILKDVSGNLVLDFAHASGDEVSKIF